MLIRRKLIYIILSVSVLIIWSYVNYYVRFLALNYRAVSIRMQDNRVTKQDIITALENEEFKGSKDIPKITAWQQVKDQSFECPELGTEAKLSVIEYWGDIACVMPIKPVRGNVLSCEDGVGCIITENAAYSLFRTRDAVGRELTYQDKSYYIRGIIKVKEDILLVPITNNENTYSNLELVYDNKVNGQQYVHAFMQQNGLGKDYTVVDGCFYARLLRVASGLPLWVLGVAILYLLVCENRKGGMEPKNKQMYKSEDNKLQKENLTKYPKLKKVLNQVMLVFILTVAVLLFIRLVSELIPAIPDRFIPTRWSDFSFWTKRLAQAGEQLSALKYLTPVIKDIIFFQAIWRCSLLSLLASVIILFLLIKRKT